MTHPITGHARRALDPDVILAALREARQRRDEADEAIRVLLAYAREFTRPRPYRLADLADAAGMSISGVRTGYTRRRHIEQGARLLAPAIPAPAANGIAPGGYL